MYIFEKCYNIVSTMILISTIIERNPMWNAKITWLFGISSVACLSIRECKPKHFKMVLGLQADWHLVTLWQNLRQCSLLQTLRQTLWVLDLALRYCLPCGSRENSLTGVAGVFGNFYGRPLTPPGIEFLDGRKLCPRDVLGRTHYPL